ncbi:MAG TPA: hypothetical protein VMZ91_01090 [Candidatus Paceibacterota bacterium]|nr:hypothetical protein [Candidatus Paceibacterota bacterium]
MGKPLNKNFDLEKFVETYISNALELAKVSMRVSLSQESFYQGIFYSVAKDMAMEEEQVTYLHHAFHWYLFNRNSESLLESTMLATNKEVPIVQLRKRRVNIMNLTEGFLKTYSGYLEQRVRTLQQS